MFRRSFVRAAYRARLPVHAWIVDDPDDMRQLIGWGVTGIISDRPDVAVEIVKSVNSTT
jgi:glycerophosphoryl diester phosphodiesterase